MEIATVRRTLNHTLTELKRAIDRYAVAVAADLYALAWQQAAGAPPSETREQRAQLKDLKEVLGSRRWQEEERRQAAAAPLKSVPPQPKQPVAAPLRVRPDIGPAGESVVRSSGRKVTPPAAPRRSTAPPRPPVPVSVPTPVPAPDLTPVVKVRTPRREQPALLETGQLWEFATELRPLLEQTARAGSTTTWPQVHKRLPGLPRLHADDQCVLLWLVDEDGRKGEPLLSALVTVEDRQMHPRFPAVAEQLGWKPPYGARPHTAWSYEVLKVHQHWRHRR
ncbi:hypothetical protein OHA84_38175 (plasmid) [Streptomyces sp. NBC_00513]|uniref:hypothetical protein n=1 Tax=unclassified Streptomyces TaxID=2593676 RepID=UPI00225185A3|nr:hypothetical protein [Streptomyces sp. NBC_00424]MCX5079174.1 hypothetical protein [Streptomyces sp. NBC_00424]WUD46361.1 hypothetical protein OHA84_38175 [Streptomyces sp. NBC_00513]